MVHFPVGLYRFGLGHMWTFDWSDKGTYSFCYPFSWTHCTGEKSRVWEWFPDSRHCKLSCESSPWQGISEANHALQGNELSSKTLYPAVIILDRNMLHHIWYCIICMGMQKHKYASRFAHIHNCMDICICLHIRVCTYSYTVVLTLAHGINLLETNDRFWFAKQEHKRISNIIYIMNFIEGTWLPNPQFPTITGSTPSLSLTPSCIPK